jgi:hypothetical protein
MLPCQGKALAFLLQNGETLPSCNGRDTMVETNETEDIMIRWICVILAAGAACFLGIAFGLPLAKQAFALGSFGVTYTMLVFAGLVYLFHRVTK